MFRLLPELRSFLCVGYLSQLGKDPGGVRPDPIQFCLLLPALSVFNFNKGITPSP